ncbi:MAG: serine protease [Planctomycetota bacterium]|nr:serine protease [Planctomycetota bacterium]
MLSRRESTKAFVSEALTVLAIVTAFYLLQTQIFQVRYDIYGRTSGLALAQERTETELGDTQRYVQDLIQDSTLELARAREGFDESLEKFRRERDELVLLLSQKTRELEQGLSDRLERERRGLRSLEEKAEANSTLLETLKLSFVKDVERMKHSMIFPTVQLRGNGTVGSGVLIYSRAQPELEKTSVHTTFALTACHVVQEVLAETLEPGRNVDEVRILGGDGTQFSELYSAQLVLFDVDRDIALMRVNSSRRFPHLAGLLPLDEFEKLDIFSPAYAVGCPLGNRPMPTLGEISSKTKVVGEQNFWMLNAPTFFGNSGGGIYHTPRYELIGVSSMIYTYGKQNPTVVPHMGLFVPVDTIYGWLEENGFQFIYRGRPVPRHFREELVYVDEGKTFSPRPAAAGPEVTSDPG